MATYYVRSTDGNNADTGLTWALAEADLHTPTWAAGDTVYVSQAHAQSTAAAITIDLNGTLAAPQAVPYKIGIRVAGVKLRHMLDLPTCAFAQVHLRESKTLACCVLAGILLLILETLACCVLAGRLQHQNSPLYLICLA